MTATLRLWHSGMLLILVLLCWIPSIFSVPPANFKISWDATKKEATCGGNKELYNQDIQIKWRMGNSSSEFILGPTLDLSNTEEDQDYFLECFASNLDGTSYATLSLKKTSTDLSEVGSVKLTFDSELHVLRCKSESSSSGDFLWFKNADKIPPEFKVAVISSSEQQLHLNSFLWNANGTYGCLVKENGYAEIGVSFPYKPELSTNVVSNSAIATGSLLSLTCSVRSFSNITVLWFQDGYPVSCAGRKQDKCSIEAITSQTSVLSIFSAERDNSGTYECIAYDQQGHESKNDINITVLEHMPVISGIEPFSAKGIHEGAEFLVLEGSALSLDCKHNGSTLLWNLPNGSIESDVNPLQIEQVTSDHQGTYVCTVANSLGKPVAASLTLGVVLSTRIKEPKSLELDVEPSVEPLRLLCDPIVDPRLLTSIQFEWVKDGHIILGNSAELVLNKVTKNTSGEYTCIVRSLYDFISPVEQHWSVKVKLAPIIIPTFPNSLPVVTSNSLSTVLNCAARGIPDPAIEWKHEEAVDNEMEDIDDMALYPRNVVIVDSALSDITRSDLAVDIAGVYRCIATNEHGSSQLAVKVVLVHPTIPLKEGFQNGSVVNADAGSSVNLQCEARVDPQLAQFDVSFQWTKDGVELTDNKEPVLHIPYLIDREHAGTYACIVHTSVDRLVLVQKLTVKTLPPKLKKPANQSLMIHEGGNISLSCQVESGIPTPTVQLKFNSSLILSNDMKSDDDKHIIQQLSRAKHEGTYTCLAVNEYGSDSYKIDLKVMKPTTITQGPEDIVMKTLGTVHFPCLVDADPRTQFTITWLYNKTVKLTSPSDPHHLTINQVTKEHEGRYSCQVNSPPFGSINQTARLTVLGEPPSFIATEKNVQTIEGSTAILSCQANGMPLPQISWHRQGITIDTTTSDAFTQSLLGDLTISSLALEDQGMYQCQASNIYGTIYHNVTVEVIKKSVPNDFDQEKGVVKNVHDNVTLTCGIYFDPRISKETHVHWFKLEQPEGSRIKIDMDNTDKFGKLADNSLAIYALSVEDKGKYLCSVKTPFESLEYQVELFVHGEPPKILSHLKKMTLYEGQDLVIECLVKGVPQPTLEWFFNDKPLTKYVSNLMTHSQDMIESKIQIPKVTKFHEGVYQCEAANTYGSGVAKFAKVNVVRRTVVQISEEAISVHAGQNLRIPCSVEQDPLNRITNIKWTKNGEAIKVGAKDRIDFGMDGSISIADVQKRHAGLYRCTVSTVLDNATAEVPVQVVVNAPVIVGNSGNQVIFGGSSITLSCKANGIPEPSLTWMFNDTVTKVVGSEFTVTNAILSDNGKYECFARNQYGQTSKAMHVQVVHMAPLQSEYIVNSNDDLILPCYDYEPSLAIEVVWNRNGMPIVGSNILINGSLLIKNMSEGQSGKYSCSASLPSGRRGFGTTTNVRLKPALILSQGKELTFTEGQDIFLECSLLKDVKAKRIWQINGDYFYVNNDRTSYENRGGLFTIQKALPSDSGNYTCLAQTTSEEDMITYKLTVTASRQHWTPGVTKVACSEVKDRPVTDLQAFKEVSQNDSARIEWQLPEFFNDSCYNHIALVWWTNADESSFNEMQLPVDKTQVTLGPLEVNLTYYIQVNLIAPLNVQVYGHTLKFSLDTIDEYVSRSIEDAGSAFSSTPSPLVIVVISVVLVAILMVLAACFWRYRQKWSKPDHRFARNSVHIRHQYTCPDWCYGHSSSTVNQDHTFEKTNFNGFDTGMYESAIITADATKRTSFIEQPILTLSNGARGDFMSNLAPQWPEPEEGDPFLAGSHTTFDVVPKRKKQYGSEESISGSWSSVFNVASSGTVSIRPNSVAVSNLSSSGSAADYAAKVAFVNTKYRKNT